MTERDIIKYLYKNHDQNIKDAQSGMISEEDNKIFSILVDLKILQEENNKLYLKVLNDLHQQSEEWSDVFYKIQIGTFQNRPTYLPQVDLNIEKYKVRFYNAPFDNSFPKFCGVKSGQFVQFRGRVLRSVCPRLIQIKKEFFCPKCKEKFFHEAKYNYSYVFESIKCCPTLMWKGVPYESNQDTDVNVLHCIKFQEMEVQPTSEGVATVILNVEQELCDIVAPGECVAVCGTVEYRYKPVKTAVQFVIRVNSIIREDIKPLLKVSIEEHIFFALQDWNELLKSYSELQLRDRIIASIAPKLKGMYPLKLAVALVLCSIGNKCDPGNPDFVRENSHLMMVGDPGLGKTELLKAASKIALRSVLTTGMGSTKAGLTAAAVKENGEWQLEAGALVLADGGVCCIDEFNQMKSTDKASIHEAMEQQTVSTAKAGIVCKLNSRCSIIAGMNQKNVLKMIDHDGISVADIDLTGALLSRFDLVFILESDLTDIDWNLDVADHMLNELSWKPKVRMDLWNIETLQSHFIVSQNIDVKIDDDAYEILTRYYQAYRNSNLRDPSRTSMRFFESLVRLTKAHARLLLREEANILDIISIIRLMESSFGFGKLVAPMNIIKEKLPLGPNKQQMIQVLEELQSFEFIEKVNELPTRTNSQKMLNLTNSTMTSTTQADLNQPDFGDFCDLNSILHDSDEGDDDEDSQNPAKPLLAINSSLNESNIKDDPPKKFPNPPSSPKVQSSNKSFNVPGTSKQTVVSCGKQYTEEELDAYCDSILQELDGNKSKVEETIPKTPINLGKLKAHKKATNSSEKPTTSKKLPAPKKPNSNKKIDKLSSKFALKNKKQVVVEQSPPVTNKVLNNIAALASFFNSNDEDQTFSQCLERSTRTNENTSEVHVGNSEIEATEESTRRAEEVILELETEPMPSPKLKKVATSTLAKLKRFRFEELDSQPSPSSINLEPRKAQEKVQTETQFSNLSANYSDFGAGTSKMAMSTQMNALTMRPPVEVDEEPPTKITKMSEITKAPRRMAWKDKNIDWNFVDSFMDELEKELY